MLVLDDQERQLLALQLFAHAAPDAAKADENQMILEVCGRQIGSRWLGIVNVADPERLPAPLGLSGAA
jgi:hypothetical protein